MQFIYAIINFLILAALIWLLGRKMIASIFKKRLDKINSELDEAEEIEKTEYVAPILPDVPLAADENIDKTARKKLDAIKLSRDEEIANIEKHCDAEILEMCYDVVSVKRAELIKKVRERIIELLGTEPYHTELHEKLIGMADKILERIKLTPGDIAYLNNHDVLYVTLTSAEPLPDDIVEIIDEKTKQLVEEVNGRTSFWVKVDEELIGGLRLRIGDTVYDSTVTNHLYNLQKTLEKRPLHGDETPDEIVSDILTGISEIDTTIQEFQLGRVISISDGICWLDGLADIMYGEVIEFDCGERGMVLDIEPDKIGCVVYGNYAHIEAGSRVRRVGRIASVPVGEELLGRVVDPLGHALDGRGRIWTKERRPIECRAPGIPDRAAVSRPMHTGIKAIDALVPIGKGQRELIIGDRQTGKSSIILDTIINQRGKGTACIYVAIGQKDTTIAEVVEKLEKYGAMDYTTVVCAPASSSASLQYIAPFAGAAMAEYFMYSGRDVLIFYDDLSKHAVAYRELSLLLHRPSGREAYPGDVFYLHSRLLERAAQLSPELGGGSMTALPIIETQAGDISAYIPTNVISITDGQIFLESELFNEGQRPAVNVGLSVSRVGSAAQTKAMKQVSASLRMRLAQYRELAGFAQFGSDLDADTKAVLDSGKRMMAALRQGRFAPLEDWQQVLVIFAVSEGFASGISEDGIGEYERELYSYFEANCEDIVDEIKTGKKMSPELIARIKNALGAMTKAEA